MKKYVTKAELFNMGACVSGLGRFIEQTNDTKDPVLITSLIGGKNTVADFIWLAEKLYGVERVIEFACETAITKIELIKPFCSEEEYRIIEEFLSTGASTYTAYNTLTVLCRNMSSSTDCVDYPDSYAVMYAIKSAACYCNNIERVEYARNLATYLPDLDIDFTPYLYNLFREEEK